MLYPCRTDLRSALHIYTRFLPVARSSRGNLKALAVIAGGGIKFAVKRPALVKDRDDGKTWPSVTTDLESSISRSSPRRTEDFFYPYNWP